MRNHIVKRKGYLSKLASSLDNLRSATEWLSLRNIRSGHLPYFFAFPLAMIFINTQDFILGEKSHLFGLPETAITFFAFAAGSILIFALATPKNIAAICKGSVLLAVLGLIPWLFFPRGHPATVCAIVFMAGIGGCVSGSSFSYVFVLNNAERFFGSVLIILLVDLVELSTGFSSVPPSVRKIFALVLIVLLCVCVFLTRQKDYAEAGEKTVKKFDPSIWLTLFLFMSYFSIRITGFYAPAFAHPPTALLWGILALALLSVCVVQQVLFKRSIWTLCNVFFLSSVLSYVMWYAKLPEMAYLFSEVKEIGLMIIFYLIGCVTNKFCDFHMHKRLVLICMTAVGVLYLGIDALHAFMLNQSIALLTTASLFVIFLLLSPAFSQFLFFAGWSEEFHRIRMTLPNEDVPQADAAEKEQLPNLDDTNLSPREKQVVILLLRGRTLRQAATELGLTVSTVSTYSKTIYKKLGINSRAELFLLFGPPSGMEPPRPSQKE